MDLKKKLLASAFLLSNAGVPVEAAQLCYLNQFGSTFWVKDQNDNDAIVNGLNEGILGQWRCADVQPGHVYKFEYHGLGNEPGIIEKTACKMEVPDPKKLKGYQKTDVYLKVSQYPLDAMCEIWDIRDWGSTKRSGTQLPPE